MAPLSASIAAGSVGRGLRVLPRVLHRHEGPPGNIQTFTPELYVLRIAQSVSSSQSRMRRFAIDRLVDSQCIPAPSASVNSSNTFGPGSAS